MVDERFTLRTHSALDDDVLAQLWTAASGDFVMTPFQSRGFLKAFYGNMPSDCSPVLVSATEAASGRLAMVLPLIKRETAMMRYIEAADLDLADYVAPAMAEWFDPDAQEIASIWKRLREVLPKADILTLKKIPGQLPGGRTNPLTLLPDTVPMGTVTKTISLLDVDREDHYLRSGIYKDGMRKLRRLQKLGKVEFRMAATADEAADMFAHLLRQRIARFEALERFDPLNEPWVEAFYRERAMEGTVSGETLIGGLYLDDQCIGTDLGFVNGDTHIRIATALESGELERYSPGTIAFMLVLDETRARGIGYYDLGIGELGYKSRFTGPTMQVYERHEALSQRGQFAVLQTWARRMIRHGVKNYPQLRGPAEKVRRRLRQLRG